MSHAFLDIVATPSVMAEQTANGSRAAYERMSRGEVTHDRLGEDEAAFIAARDSLYMATVSETGWPYLQHRGGPVGFLKVIDEQTLAFADFSGNRQYVSRGNLRGNDRVSLFLMDYPARRRLKLLGRVTPIDFEAEPKLREALTEASYRARVEQGYRISIAAFDWNCPQHITPRYTEDELAIAMAPALERMSRLEAENQALRARLNRTTPETPE
jgi:uncharacterized protein